MVSNLSPPHSRATRHPPPVTVLGIETSCDETAAAVVTDDRRILSNVVRSQWDTHRPYGGVVPEIAARAHIEHLEPVIAKALEEAGLRLPDIDAVAVTAGPGLIGGVIVGVMAAKTIASVHGKPFLAVNHLEGHALTARLTDDVAFPYLLLLASGGHCQFAIVHGPDRYEPLGATLDDALGEAYDKVAKMLGLGLPGGPKVEAFARQGNPRRFAFPAPLAGREGCDFSFSGLKTAVWQEATKFSASAPFTEPDKADLCASFQAAAGASVADRTASALRMARVRCPGLQSFVMAGGVAANQYLRGILETVVREHGLPLIVPPPALCTDNAAMIAWAGIERLRAGHRDALDFEPRARWPLGER